jgi:dihydroxyacetone kinase phosphoprotein-dependent L subunit
MTQYDFQRALLYAADDLIAREKELSKLDSMVGDGDHGITIRKGFNAIKEMINREKPASINSLLMNCGMTVSETSGGAIGPILSAFFLGMTKAAPEGDFFSEELSSLFEAGLAQVRAVGGAAPGDKTLVDVLTPVVDALKTNTALEPKSAMKIAVKAAWEGAQSTRDMVSRKGRSKNLGERSKGYVDAGSMSMYYFFRAFTEGL